MFLSVLKNDDLTVTALAVKVSLHGAIISGPLRGINMQTAIAEISRNNDGIYNVTSALKAHSFFNMQQTINPPLFITRRRGAKAFFIFED